MKHSLTLADKKDLKRIQDLLTNYARIMKILNEDSKESPGGGAALYYEVEIKFKEVWS